MKNNKKFNVIMGYILIIVGICLPLYSLINISYRNISENINYKDYQSNNFISEEEKQGIELYNERIKENYIVDPFISEEYSSTYDFYKKHPDKIFAYLNIPKIDVKKPVYLDASYKHLDMGLGHVDGTSLPVGGKNKRSVIAGHRGWYKDLMFFNLHKLEKNDRVYIVYDNKTLEYKVTDKEIILPSDWDALQPRPNEDVLTLLTCDPIRPPSPYRLLVNCVRVKDINANDQNKEQKYSANKDNSIDSGVKKLTWLVYFTTIALFSLLIYVIFKLIKYIS